MNNFSLLIVSVKHVCANLTLINLTDFKNKMKNGLNREHMVAEIKKRKSLVIIT